MEEQEMMIVDAEPTMHARKQAGFMVVWAMGLTSLAFLGVIGYAIYLVHQYLVYLGYVALAGAGLVLLCAVAFPVIYILQLIFRARSHEIPQNGLAFRSLFGRTETIAPQAPANSVRYAQEKRAKKDQAPAFPMLSMLDMIDQGVIAPGATRVVLGYKKNGELEARKRPNVYAIVGKGRSGKSRRATMMIGQDMIGLAPLFNLTERRAGARVIVCDPHGLGKRDALRKLLEPLSPWVEFASTEAEVRSLVSQYVEEMEARLSNNSALGMEDGHYVPWVIYFDEWSRFMTKYDDDMTELLITCVQSSAQEYAGVDGYVALLGQDWTQEAAGGTGIRRAIQEVFIHNISSEYAKFFLKGLAGNKWAVKAESLRVKDCIYKDYEGQVEELITPHVADEVPARLAEMMLQLCPPAPKEIPTFAEGLVKPKRDSFTYTQGGQVYTRETSGLREQVAYYPQIPERTNGRASQEEIAQFERENIISLPEAEPEVNTEVLEGSNGAEMNKDIYKAALRDIAKRLKAGETANDIRKSLEVNGGRALQEVNAALKVLDEDIDSLSQ